MSKPNADKSSGAQASGARKFTSEYCDIARNLLARGITDLANIFGVSETQVRRWKLNYPEFAEACRVGRERALEQIELALYEAATCNTRFVKKVVSRGDRPVIVKYCEHVPPDIKIAKFWLERRAPAKWSQKLPVEEEEDPITRMLRELKAKVLRPGSRYGTSEDNESGGTNIGSDEH